MSTDTVSPLRQRMIEDMSSRKLGPHSQRSHISSCKRFAAFLGRSPETTASATMACWPKPPAATTSPGAHAFATYLAPLRKAEWVVYSKRPFGGPEAVLAYLSRYTHRVAISNSRLIAFDHAGVTFRWKDYRIKGHHRYKLMTLAVGEFIRRFLIHVLPKALASCSPSQSPKPMMPPITLIKLSCPHSHILVRAAVAQ